MVCSLLCCQSLPVYNMHLLRECMARVCCVAPFVSELPVEQVHI